MGYLNNLTSLNLASNRLSTFPLQILALRHLRDVDLSSNALTSLWSPKWRVELEELMKPADASPSASPESKLSPQHPGFWASFPSVQKQAALVDGAEEMLLKSMAPLNALTTLVLADNAFDDQAFTAPGFEFPPRLISLDLSSCGLTDVSLPISVLSTLPRLVRLNLSSNVLSDSFPLSPSPSSPLFPALKSIDLSNNAFDSLLNLESTLEGTGKKIDWIGLPKVISNLVRAASVIRLQSGEKERRETVECKVGENLLREEQGRRRGLFPPNPSTPQPVRVVEARVTTMVDVPAAVEVMVQEEAGGEKEAWELEAASGLLTEGGRRRARAEAARRTRETPTATPVRTVVEVMESLKLEDGEDSTPPSPSPTARLPPPPYCADKVAEVKLEEQAVEELEVEEEGEDASEEDPAVVLVSSAFDPTTRVLDLSRRKLDAILVPTTGTPPSRLSPSTLNLSHNVFTTLPLSTLSAWSWISLSTLDLSHNSISALSLLSLPSPLPSLHSLNLSSNALPSTLDSTPLLSSLHTLFPSLSILELSYNQLSTVEGISSLLFGGIEKLNLRGNQIETIEELVDVAKTCDGKPVVEGWKCIELDLQDNSIGRVSPSLFSSLDGN
jgi:Leucine-rich repeat (LRR) protein